MRYCYVCNKKSDYLSKIIKCDDLSCRYWVHKSCIERRRSSIVNNWACKNHLHKLHEYYNTVINISGRMADSKEAILSHETIIESLNQEQHDAVNTNTANDFLAQQTHQSTPTNPAEREDRDEAGPLEKKGIVKCYACKQDLKQFVYSCKGCKNKYHPFCITAREEGTLHKETESFVCNKCVDLLIQRTFNSDANSVNAKRTTQVKTYPQKINISSTNLIESSSEEDLRSTGSARHDGNEILHGHGTITSNKTITSEQFFYKLQLKKLPEVVDADVSWNVFYASFIDTKDLFTHYENVIRVQTAIKDESVKRIGGKGLFNLKTYARCIENVNKRLKQNMNFLTDEAFEIENFQRIRPENKVKLVEFLDKIRNFCTIAEAYEDKSYITNRRFLANIGNIVPYNLRNKWEAKQADLEANNRTPTLIHMVEVLDKELPRIEASIRNDKVRIVDKKSDNSFQHKNVYKSSKFNYTNDYGNPSSKITLGKYHSNENDNYLCWYHKTNDHTGNRCRSLWDMDGKTVSNLAKLHKVCTYCGYKQHKPCPFSFKLKCRVEGCGHSHHSLFCYKRKAKTNSTNFNNNDRPKTSNNYKHQFKRDDNQKTSKKPEASNSKPAEEADDSEAELQEMIKRFTNIKDTNNVNVSSKDNRNNVNTSNPPSKSYSIKVQNGQISKNHNKLAETDKTLLGVIVLELENNLKAAFLLDSGSTVSLIEEDIANKLNLSGPWFPLTLLWSGNYSRKEKLSRVVKVKVKSLNDNPKEHELFFRTVRNLKMCEQKFNLKDYEDYPQLKSLKLVEYNKLSGVIGIDNLFAFDRYLTIKAKGLNGIDYHGVKSPLGDYLYGSNTSLNCIYNELSALNLHSTKNDDTTHDLSEQESEEYKIMEEEVMGINYNQPSQNDRLIHEEKRTIDLLNNEVKKLDDSNKFIAPLLWKQEKLKLPTEFSYNLALKRYLIVEKQAHKLNKFDECSEQIRNLLEKNYARELTAEEILNPSDIAYYNPIFFIHPPSKRTRLIWDLAAKIQGKCLNDYISTGPNLYANMLDIQFQMREGQYLVKGDIGEMFHQIKVREQDTDALRFMFRFNPNEKLRYFKMLVLPFGAKCSPVISQFVKNKIAKQAASKHPETSEVILNNCYVDDLVKSTNSLKNVVKLTTEAKNILHNGGFNLLKINCTNNVALEAIKCCMANDMSNNPKLFSEEHEEKLLGYSIDFYSDEIYVAPSLSKIPTDILLKKQIPSKKQVLQTLMSLFDPIGFVQFLTSKLKLIYHITCLNKYEWDDLLDGEILELWYKCMDWISQVENIKIPRKYCDDNTKVARSELWAFGDAGKHIMCGVLYALFFDIDGKLINVRMIYAKTFVVPCKQSRTIPELEVTASSKICEMAKKVVEAHHIKFDDIKYVTDSMVVKEWITTGAKKPTIYVKNRLDTIKSLSKPNQWIWVPSELMPADMGTKETAMPEMTYNNSWFQPLLFCFPKETWNSYESKINNSITTTVTDTFDEEDDILDANKFSKFRYLIYSAMMALKWQDIAKTTKVKNQIEQLLMLKASDHHNRSLKNEIRQTTKQYEALICDLKNKTLHYKHVENLAIKKCQNDAFEKEILILKSKRKLPKNNLLYKLSPFLDENEILRATSRISFNEKNVQIYGQNRIFPILMPNNHKLTHLIILKQHENNFHMLENTVITKLLKKYYIPNIKSTVRKVIKNNCMMCKRLNFRPEIPMMGNLPSYRLAYHVTPFTYSIIDLAGPIFVKNYRNRDVKRYIFVYGCLTTRAVHLELLEDLSANSTLLALQCTINLRGAPKRIVTDNGTNFIGAKNILDIAQTEWNSQLLEKGMIVEPIEWDFAPAKAPHQQGAVERMVGLVKTALSKLITSLNRNPHRYNDFQMRCILCEIIGMLNSRPISMIPIEGTNNHYLTPNQFLMGKQNVQTVPISNRQISNLTEYWLDIKILTNILWKHWLNAYIPSIMMREKWFDKKSPLKVDDIVLVADPSLANSWRLGRIIAIKLGSQDQVRSVTIQLGKNRPLNCQLKNVSKDHILKVYKEEGQSIITRPALAVTRLDIM